MFVKLSLMVVASYMTSFYAYGDPVLKVKVSDKGEVLYEDAQPAGIAAVFTDNVFGRWVRPLQDGNYVSSLADFKFADDKRYVDLDIKPGASFHNGRHLTAEDIEFSLMRVFWQTNSDYYWSFLECVEGVTSALQRPAPGSISGIKVLSGQKLRLQFTRPCPEILSALSLSFFAPRAREEMKDDMIHFKHLPVGAGPYAVSSETAQGYRLKKVYGSGPDQVNLITSGQNGSPDVYYSKLDSPPDFSKALSSLPSSTLTLFTSANHPLFRNLRLRSLFNRAFDRAKLQKNFSFEPSYSLSLQGTQEPTTLAEIQVARREIRQILKGMNYIELEVPVQTREISGPLAEVVNELKLQFVEMGLTVRFVANPKQFLSVEDAQAFPFWLWWLVIDPLSPQTMLSGFLPNGGYEFMGTQSSVPYFQAIQSAKTADSTLKAQQVLDQFLSDAGHGIPLLRRKTAYSFNPKTVETLGEQVESISLDLSRIKVRTCHSSVTE